MISSKYDGYIEKKKLELVNDLIHMIGFNSLDDSGYITYDDIQNDIIGEKMEKMLPALRTVFKTYTIRSISRKNKDKRFCLNILRQVLKDVNYKLETKTYSLIRNEIITSSTKYCIMKD
jgi:hypothetical protein